MTSLKQLLDTDYEVRIPVFEGPLDLLLYLVEKSELNPKDVSISAITDQYLEHLQALEQTELANAGEFLVMAARLMRLKARDLLPADQKDDLEEMEYLLDRQALIAQMLEYQKFKEAARALRSIEAQHFGAFPRGRPERFGEGAEAEEAGVYDLLTAFRSVLSQVPRIPVHEVEIDDVTIEDRMQHVETELLSCGRSLFEDLFESDPRRIVKVVTFMAVLELCKLDRITFRQNRALGTIWVYAKEAAPLHALELQTTNETQLDPLPEFRPGLVAWVQEQILKRKAQTSLEKVMEDLAAELQGEGAEMPDASQLGSLAEAASDPIGPGEIVDGENEEELS